jgi:hypothetical protein
MFAPSRFWVIASNGDLAVDAAAAGHSHRQNTTAFWRRDRSDLSL